MCSCRARQEWLDSFYKIKLKETFKLRLPVPTEVFCRYRTMASFEIVYGQFLEELTLTFPEYKPALTLAASIPDASDRFVAVWRPHISEVAAQDNSIFETGIELVSGFVMTAALWKELSAATQAAMWKYISSLMLLAAQKKEAGFFDISGFSADMDRMMEMLKGGDTSQFGDLFEKLSKMAESFGFKDLSGAAGKFKIPERMFKGHIARIAQELVAELKPEDFGIDPELMKSNDPKAVFEFLQEVFTKKPDMLMSVAQKIANKIKTKFMRGEIRREEIIAEAEELMKEFSENDMFSELFGSLREAMVGGEKASGNEGSSRRREVQERLRKKAAEKTAAKAGTTGTTATNVVVPTAEAEARAAAAIAELIAEEDREEKEKAAKGAKGNKGAKGKGK